MLHLLNLPSPPMDTVWAVMETGTGFCFYTLHNQCQYYGYLRNAESPVSASRDAAGDDHNHPGQIWLQMS